MNLIHFSYYLKFNLIILSMAIIKIKVLIKGIGVGLATSAAFVALNHYFKNKRGQAVGLSMAGTALGMLFMPQLIRILLETYGFRGALLLISGMALHSAVGVTTLQPIKWHLKEELVDIELSNAANENTEILNEDDEDDLPEMKNILFSNNNRMRKNFSDVGFSNMNNGMSNRPTFPRVMSNVSTAGMVGNGLEMSIRKRKVSVMSHLSQLDFTGSNLQVHMNVCINIFSIYIYITCTEINIYIIISFRLVTMKPKNKIKNCDV